MDFAEFWEHICLPSFYHASLSIHEKLAQIFSFPSKSFKGLVCIVFFDLLNDYKVIACFNKTPPF